MNTKNKGFTLSEVLVTLGVLGIIGALVIPLMAAQAPNKDVRNKIMFRKAYNTMERVISNMINDDVNYPVKVTDGSDSDIATVDYQTGHPRGFNYTTATTNGTVNKFCYFFAQNLNTVGPITCPDANTDWPSSRAILFATTSDGMLWFIANYDYNQMASSNDRRGFRIDPPTAGKAHYNTKILVDVNGASGPNCTKNSTAASSYMPTGTTHTYSTTACNNPDTFMIGVRYDGKLRATIGSINETTTAISDSVAQSILNDPLNISN